MTEQEYLHWLWQEFGTGTFEEYIDYIKQNNYE